MVLGCDGCGIRVEGPFQLNEFATLSADDLHFLRIFVLSEGRVRDMQSSLGLSYPTIRARLTLLKTNLLGTTLQPNPRIEKSKKAKRPVELMRFSINLRKAKLISMRRCGQYANFQK